MIDDFDENRTCHDIGRHSAWRMDPAAAAAAVINADGVCKS